MAEPEVRSKNVTVAEAPPGAVFKKIVEAKAPPAAGSYFSGAGYKNFAGTKAPPRAGPPRRPRQNLNFHKSIYFLT